MGLLSRNIIAATNGFSALSLIYFYSGCFLAAGRAQVVIGVLTTMCIGYMALVWLLALSVVTMSLRDSNEDRG